MKSSARSITFTMIGLAALSLAAAACASNADSASDSSNSDLTGSIGNAQACAIRDAYRAASLSDFTPDATGGQLLAVPHVGTVLVTESAEGDGTRLAFTLSGVEKLDAYTDESIITFYRPVTGGGQAPLVCNGDTPYVDAGGGDATSPWEPDAAEWSDAASRDAATD